jgi:hypothetical protein
MKKFSILLTCVFVFIAILTIPENTQAQGRRKPVKVRVVRHHTRVVKVHPRVVRRAHIRYAHLPRWGALVSQRPANAILIASNHGPYHFHNGIYYIHRKPGFAIVRPVPGIRIRVLPVGYRYITVRNRPYYYYYGTFYTKAVNDEYEVVNAPEGAIVDALPDGYDVKTIGDTEYYVLDGVHYAEVDTDETEDGVGYQVVKI